MISVTPEYLAALNATQNSPLDLYELYLDGGTYYFTDQTFVWNGHTYHPYVKSRSDIKRYMTGQFDQVTVTFSNTDTYMASLVATNDIEGSALIIRRVMVGVTNDSVVIFNGFLQRPSQIDEDDCVLTGLEFLGSIDFDFPARFFQPTCPFPFKGPECGYTGSNTSCDQSWANCLTNSNTDKFGGFRFVPHAGVYQYQQTQVSRFLLFFSRKKTTTTAVAYNSVDDTPYDVPIPIVLGRAQLAGIPIEHEDTGTHTNSLQAFCVGSIYGFRYILANQTLVDNFDEHGGYIGGTSLQVVDPRFSDSYPYNLLAYMGITVPSDVNTVDPAPNVTAVILGCVVDRYNADGTYAGFGWSDNPIWNIRHVMQLSLAQGGMGIPAEFFDDSLHASEAAYCDELVDNPTNDQKIFVADPIPDGYTVGENYKRFRSTSVSAADPGVDGPYFDFTPGVDDDTSRTPDVLSCKRFTLNTAIAQASAPVDALYKQLLPSFRGYITQSKEGKIQIRCERANPNTTLSTNIAAGLTSIPCVDPTKFTAGDLVLASPLTANAEVFTVDSVASDHFVIVQASGKAHLAGDELLKIQMKFDDSTVCDGTKIVYPLTDRQDSINRVTVTYPDAPSGFQQIPLRVNDYTHQAKVRKVNNLDVDGSCIDSYFQAWRIGQWQLAKLRDFGTFISLRGDIKASLLQIGDVIAASSAEHGLVCVPFRVIEIGFTADDEVDIVGQLYSSAIYSDVAPQVTATVPALFTPLLPEAVLDVTVPPAPSVAITAYGQGSVTFGPITFPGGLANTRTVNNVLIQLLYQDMTATPIVGVGTALGTTGITAGLATTITADADMTGILHADDWLLIGGELVYVTHDPTSATVQVDRAVGGTIAEAHAVTDPIVKLARVFFSYQFSQDFFSSSKAPQWSATETLENAGIALLAVIAYNVHGVSSLGSVNYSQAGGLLETFTAQQLMTQTLAVTAGRIKPHSGHKYSLLAAASTAIMDAPVIAPDGFYYVEITQSTPAQVITFNAAVYESPTFLASSCSTPGSITIFTFRMLTGGLFRVINTFSYFPA